MDSFLVAEDIDLFLKLLANVSGKIRGINRLLHRGTVRLVIGKVTKEQPHYMCYTRFATP